MKSNRSTNYGFLMYLIILLVAIYIAVIYFIMDPTALPFMQLKMNTEGLPFEPWENLFYAHIIIGFVSLALGPFLFLNRTKKTEKFHVNLGIVYTSTIFINALIVPFLAIYATGGITSGAVFLIIDTAWLATTWLGVWRMAQKKFSFHKEWMIRSYTITMVFVPFRILVALLSIVFGASNALVYPLSISLAIILNLSVAEIYIHSERRKIRETPNMPA